MRIYQGLNYTADLIDDMVVVSQSQREPTFSQARHTESVRYLESVGYKYIPSDDKLAFEALCAVINIGGTTQYTKEQLEQQFLTVTVCDSRSTSTKSYKDVILHTAKLTVRDNEDGTLYVSKKNAGLSNNCCFLPSSLAKEFEALGTPTGCADIITEALPYVDNLRFTVEDVLHAAEERGFLTREQRIKHDKLFRSEKRYNSGADLKCSWKILSDRFDGYITGYARPIVMNEKNFYVRINCANFPAQSLSKFVRERNRDIRAWIAETLPDELSSLNSETMAIEDYTPVRCTVLRTHQIELEYQLRR